MKKIFALALAGLFSLGCAFAQQPQQNQQRQHGGHHCGNCQHHGQHGQQAPSASPNDNGIETAIVRAFPTMKDVKKTDRWTEVFDANGKLLGYAVYSKPASDGIKGYKGETPVLIALNPKQVIIGVYALPNKETPGYAKRVEEAGFYNSWNGLTIKQALKKEVDTVSGATYTSQAVIKSVRAALEKLNS